MHGVPSLAPPSPKAPLSPEASPAPVGGPEAAAGAIRIRGARTHNLKNVDVDVPRGRLVVITGLSGSGKSTLAFDTIYAEGQRRYVESLSAYARQFLSVMEKPDVDHIEGLSPAIAIEQRAGSSNPRSTVGTVTEIHDYLRLLFARAGEPRCPDHGVVLTARTVSQMVDAVLARPPGERLMLLAPLVRGRKGEHHEVFESLRAGGFVRARVDGRMVELDAPPRLDGAVHHDVDAVVDRFRVRPDVAPRLAESFETALALADGRATVAVLGGEGGAPDGAAGVGGRGDAAGGPVRAGAAADSSAGDGFGAGTHGSADAGAGAETVFSARFACPECGYSLPELEPRLFSFNNPAGACPDCDGLGRESYFDPERVVARPELSLPGGAVRGWDRSNVYYFGLVESLAAHYCFDLDLPFRDLPPRIRRIVLYGSGGEPLQLRYGRRDGYRRFGPFEGIIPNMERRYRETESAQVREELARYMSARPCPGCRGARLNRHARSVRVGGKGLHELARLPVADLRGFFRTASFEGGREEVAGRIVHEVAQRLDFLIDVGLDYLSLDRAADSLSGGEGRRIRLASQIGAGLVGVMYVLDEPSIGLHQRDNRRLLDSLVRLRDLGNTVIVVEHDEGAIREADFLIDMGPGPGVHGGRVVARGAVGDVMAEPASLTGQYLAGRRRVSKPRPRRAAAGWVRIRGASANNLRSVDAAFPLSVMTCVTGVSGSGKSSLVHDTLYRALSGGVRKGRWRPEEGEAAAVRLAGAEHVDKVVNIDQSPIGRTPRSNPATYAGLFTPIRELFAATPEARARGYAPGRFSFNVPGGRCEACRGDGVTRVEMHFLPDVYVRCDVCQGRRYDRETLGVHYRGKTIHDVLGMTVEEARAFFDPIPAVARRLGTLVDVGLGYVGLGQSATTLSGGEAQRMKLARELARRDTGRTLYVLDEPTTGLHFHDVRQLLEVLDRLVGRGNTVVVIEHNLDVIRAADWVIDLGPEGGAGGGRIVAAGAPEAVAAEPRSHTGRFLARMLGGSGGRRSGGGSCGSGGAPEAGAWEGGAPTDRAPAPGEPERSAPEPGAPEERRDSVAP